MDKLKLSELKLKEDLRKYFNLKVEELKTRLSKVERNRKKFFIFTNPSDEGCKVFSKQRALFSYLLGVNVYIIDVNNIMDLKEKLLEANTYKYPCMLDFPCKENIKKAYLKYISKGLDVGGLNIDEWLGVDYFNYAPPTPKGIMAFLDYLNIENFEDKKITIIGKGETVGKPLMHLLTEYYSNDVMCVTKSSDVDYMFTACKEADILICASGVRGSVGDFHTNDNKNVLVFNVGTCRLNGKIVNEYQPKKENIQYTDTEYSVGMLTMIALFDTVVRRMEE